MFGSLTAGAAAFSAGMAVAGDPTFVGISAYLVDDRVKLKVTREDGPAIVQPLVKDSQVVTGQWRWYPQSVVDRVFVEVEGVRVENFAGDEVFQLSGEVGAKLLKVLTLSAKCKYRNGDQDPCYDRFDVRGEVSATVWEDLTLSQEFRAQSQRQDWNYASETEISWGDVNAEGQLTLTALNRWEKDEHELAVELEYEVLPLDQFKFAVQGICAEILAEDVKNCVTGFKVRINF